MVTTGHFHGNQGGRPLLFFTDTKPQRDKAKPKLDSVEETSNCISHEKFWRYLSLNSIYAKKTFFSIFEKIPHYNPMGPGNSIIYSY